MILYLRFDYLYIVMVVRFSHLANSIYTFTNEMTIYGADSNMQKLNNELLCLGNLHQIFYLAHNINHFIYDNRCK